VIKFYIIYLNIRNVPSVNKFNAQRETNEYS